MIISIWRYSHLTLAVSSFLLLIIASVTGIFLAFEPVIEKSKGYKADSFDTLTLANAVPLLKQQFPGIQEITIDDNDFVIIKYATQDGDDKQAYVDPATGAILGTPAAKHPFFQWMTNLHRSLFLHETGRILVGVAAFLLILIVVSGMLLVVQRQNGWKRFFANVEKTGAAQYYHTIFGRLSLFFILPIALTGTYLAVFRFVPPPAKANLLVDEKNIKEEPAIALKDFVLFHQTPLSHLQKLQYPFSDFPEDYFTIRLSNKEVCVNQFTGEVLAEVSYSNYQRLQDLSMSWHTGRSGRIWAIILAIASGYILFFIYSGFAITLQRTRARNKNKFKPADARIVILVGSENGGTFVFASAIYRQLIQHGEKVYITDIDNFSAFPRAEQLIIMTSTYGQGEAPSNARKLEQKITQFPQAQTIRYSVVGFGSRSYTQFCKFAYDIEALMQTTQWAQPITPVYTVNDKSPQDFSDWLTNWTRLTGFTLIMPRELLSPVIKGLEKISVTGRTQPDVEAAFTIRLKSRRFRKAVSGDLLAVYPKNDHRERLYSIGKIDREIQLSVKLHEHGLGSAFLHSLKAGDTIKARLIKNKHFRFPRHAKKIILISNGTGIAPFLGMISENNKRIPIELYCGFRNQSSFAQYELFLSAQKQNGKLEKIHLSLSREGEKEYVFHRILKNKEAVLKTIYQDGVIMICGSLSMQRDVMNVLANIHGSNEAVTALAEQGKILTDCY